MTATAYTAFQRTIATEALQVHDAGCCTSASRCEIGTGLERIASSTKLAQDVHPDADRTPPRGNGNGSSRMSRAARLATDRQMAYINSLLSEIKNSADDRIHAAWEIVTYAITDETARFGGLTMERVTPILTMLKEAVAEQRAAAPVQHAARPVTSAPVQTTVTEGMYELDGAVYRVILSKANRLYASLLVPSEGRGSFEYAPGVINRLRAEHRMTLERASQLSVQYHFCVRCGRELTRESSIAQAMGDVCASKI